MKRNLEQFIPYGLFLLLIGVGALTQYFGAPASSPALALSALVDLTPSPLPTTAMTIPDEVTAESVLIGNLTTGEVYVSRAPERLAPIASLTKLFLVEAALATLNAESLVTISEAAVAEEGDQGTLLVGEQFRLLDLARLTLTSSSNDGAAAIGEALREAWNTAHPISPVLGAEHILNARIAEMHLDHTFFQNITGLDTGEAASNYSSARDLFAFARATYATPVVWELARDPIAVIISANGEAHEVVHTNPLLASLTNVIGSKTGTTDQAKESLVILMESPVGRPIAIIILGSQFSQRIEDAEILLRANQLAY
mgnify:CR=1 FL=1